MRRFIYLFPICLAVSVGLTTAQDSIAKQDPQSPSTTVSKDQKTNDLDRLREVVRTAFRETHDGWSSDEVILNTDLNTAFIESCLRSLPEAQPVDLNWALLNMRKAGLLKVKTTKRSRRSVDEYVQLAEIAARLVQDRHQVSTDRMMADPDLRDQFDREVSRINDATDLYSVRKAAFHLRKQRRLRPELITRIADWGRAIHTFGIEDVQEHPDRVPEHPGIYIFRDGSGYLYIGQSDNLRNRLQEHLAASSNFSLAEYLAQRSNDKITIEIHAFDPASRAKETMIRRAYESELIASRKPRFNIQP